MSYLILLILPVIIDYTILKKIKIDPKAKALIFDLDGTLADTMPVHFIAYKNILINYGIEFTPELFDTLAGIPAVGTIKKLNELFGTKMDPEEIGNFKEREYEKIMDKMKPVEPVVELVRNYYNKLPMSIGTGGYKRLAWKSLEIIGLKNYFDILISSEDVIHSKPHPETFLKCADLMGVEPKYCQVFEDGALGIQAANDAGMMSTLVTDYYKVTIGEGI
ncbi:MAG: HAD-IA family hydrolase [Mariniphaga sp.]|nr:HAD-IA family hydrolase [Mariniphaga sp.]